MKKNSFVSILVLFLTISLFGCSTQPKPESSIREYLDAFKTGETVDNSLYFNGSISAFNELVSPEDGTPAEVIDSMKNIMYGYSYVVKDTTIADDKESATVNIEITTVDGGSLLTNFISQYMTNAFVMIFAGKTQAEIEEYAVDLFANLSSNLEKNKVFPVTVKLIKVDKKWLMDGGDANSTLFDAMTGGMLTAAKNIQEQFN